MKRSFLLLLAAASLSAASAQTTSKTKIKTENGTVLKAKTEAAPIVLDGPIRRIETLSGIDIFPSSDAQRIYAQLHARSSPSPAR